MTKFGDKKFYITPIYSIIVADLIIYKNISQNLQVIVKRSLFIYVTKLPL